MLSTLDQPSPGPIRAEVEAIRRSLFPRTHPAFLDDAFVWVEDAFVGRHPDYQPIDARYHDFSHTLQVTLCFAHLLEGYRTAKATPELTPRAFELALLAMLLHDTGYLRERGDTGGTGAKYTLIHVRRSTLCAARLMAAHSFPPEEITAVQNMIRCTGLNADYKAILFQNDLEKTLGFALATADLIGQMAARDYIAKLDLLYLEFEEANQFHGVHGHTGTFASADDLRRRTPAFWRDYVLPRITRDFGGMHRYLARPGPSGENPYLHRIESNLASLRPA